MLMSEFWSVTSDCSYFWLSLCFIRGMRTLVERVEFSKVKLSVNFASYIEVDVVHLPTNMHYH